MPGNGRVVVAAALAMMGVAALAHAGLMLANYASGMAPLWLANVAVVASLVRFRSLRRDAVIAGAAAGLFGANALAGAGIGMSAALTAANLVEIAAGLALFARTRDEAQPLYAPRNLGAFLLTAAAIAPLLSAIIGGGYVALAQNLDVWPTMLHWYAADALGMAVLGPLILAAGCDDCASLIRSPRRFEIIGVVLGTALTTYIVFQQGRYPALFFILPVLTAAVFRLRFIGASAGIVVVAIVASAATLSGNGPIAEHLPDVGERILFLQAFLAVAVIANMPQAAVLVQRETMARQLAERELNYRILADNSNDMIVRIGLDGIRRYVSPASFAILGYAPEEMIGDTPIAAIHAEDRARVERVCRSLLDGAIDPVCSYRQRRRDGGYVWLEATYRLVRDERGAPAEFIASVRDIGKRKAAELDRTTAIARLEESHRLLQMAEGLAGVGHWRLDAINHDLFWSDEVFHIHGRALGDIPPLEEAINVYHPDDRDMVQRHVDAALSVGTPWTFRARLVRPDGDIRHVETSGQVERAPEGTIVGVVGVFRDVTSEVETKNVLIAARDEARASAEAKSAFLATMSHEIRTPMTGVLGMIELLRTDLSPQDRDRFFDNLEQSASLLMTVLDDILDFSKVESRNLVLERVDFNLNELARNTLDLFHHAASTKGLLLSLSVPVGRDTMLRGDPVRLQQIMSNLISNAIKFTMTGRIELRIDMRNEGRKCAVRCEVIDTGIGIGPAAIGKLFDPFVQADASTTRRFGGTGLGLAICKRLVEAMNGSMTVDSIEGQGTTFRFDVLLETGADMAKASLAPPPRAARPLSILLAEDNQINRALVEAIVRREGHAIQSVENGRLAVEAANAEAFDVILMDMQMPEMDGLAATRAIRTGGGLCADAPIVALTADASAERRRFYDNAGLTEFLTKPIDSALLCERLRMIAANEALVSLSHLEGAADGFPLLDEGKLGLLEQALGPASLAVLLDMLAKELVTRPLAIRKLIAIDGGAAIAAEAHSLRGATLNVGAELVGEIARRIEESVDAGESLTTMGEELIAAARATRLALDERNKRARSAQMLA